MRPLLHFLDRELAAATALSTSLAAETLALATDADALAAIVDGKFEQARQVEYLAGERMAFAATLGCAGDSAAWEEFIARADNPALSSRWQQLQGVLVQCRETNLHNGVLLDHCQRQVRTALAILQGQPLGLGLYGADGNQAPASSSRTLAKA
ncbi:MAG TPA: flagellar protein FlgN [Porticoccaceae bacterium]|nr:flagellar protein FlgN [Porticoccaceae bacterium]